MITLLGWGKSTLTIEECFNTDVQFDTVGMSRANWNAEKLSQWVIGKEGKMELDVAFRMSTASQSSIQIQASGWHRDVVNYICEGSETVRPAQSKDQSNLREQISLSYLYKYVYFNDNYHSHCLLLLHYINYLFNDN